MKNKKLWDVNKYKFIQIKNKVKYYKNGFIILLICIIFQIN